MTETTKSEPISEARLDLLIMWLEERAEDAMKTSLARRDMANVTRNATVEELREAKRMAEAMTGRTLDLVSTSVKDARRDTRMQDSIAQKYERESRSISEFADDIRGLRGELKALRQENEWISVQDRMPEYGSVVYVYCYERGDELKLRFRDLAGYSYHGGFAVGCHQHDRDVVVTHWSPLRPTPPAPRTEEK